jgi:hypothetical protein
MDSIYFRTKGAGVRFRVRVPLVPNAMKRSPTALFVFLLLLSVYIPARATAPAELPRVYMRTEYALPLNGNTFRPQNSADFQTALNTCHLGDVIELRAGVLYQGPFTLPNKTVGMGWIYIVSSALAQLPGQCTRVSPSDAVNMPKITVLAGAGGAVQTVSGAHHFRFVGIEFRPVTGNYVYNIVQIGNGETTEAALPNNIVLDRCYVHGDSSAGSRRGVMMNGAAIAVIDSYVSDCKEVGADSQALGGWSMTGPIKIVDNYLEGAGENVIFGGADPSIPNAVASDIEIRCNTFFKPLKWMKENWVIKNLLEFKNAQRVLVEGNHFENCWPSGQNGFCLLLTPRNQNNTAPWSVVQDITIRRNVFVNIAQGINMSGFDAPNKSQRTSRVRIQDNLIRSVYMLNSDGRLFQVLNGLLDVVIDHNTGFCSNAYLVADGASPRIDSFVFTNNIVSHANYGFIGTGTAYANTTLAAFFTPNWTVSHNVDFGGSPMNYPPGSFFPATIAGVGFIDTAAGNFRLSASSPYKNAAADGSDLGANMDSIAKASTYICDSLTASVHTSARVASIELYPSPADRSFTIGREASDHTVASIAILDALGREIYSRPWVKATEIINCEAFRSGMYAVQVRTTKGVGMTKLLVRH